MGDDGEKRERERRTIQGSFMLFCGDVEERRKEKKKEGQRLFLKAWFEFQVL